MLGNFTYDCHLAAALGQTSLIINKIDGFHSRLCITIEKNIVEDAVARNQETQRRRKRKEKSSDCKGLCKRSRAYNFSFLEQLFSSRTLQNEMTFS